MNIKFPHNVFVTSLMLTSVLSMNQTMKEYILQVHNRYRAAEGASNMNKLVWDADLEREAASWADTCVFRHTDSAIGENLALDTAIRSPESEKIDIAMAGFYNEKVNYTYGQNSCSRPAMACHYTQLVWAKTRRVGCASRICTPLIYLGSRIRKAWYLVCKYNPPGNWFGQRPYRTGAVCSRCNGDDSCEEGLCNVCEDTADDCYARTGRGECVSNEFYMRNHCRQTCDMC